MFVYARADDEGTVHALRSGRNVIGRDPACDVLVNDPRVSGNHALIFLKPEETTYVDTSANGSLVDGKVIHGDTARIANGAVIDVGDARLIFVRVPRELVDAPRP